MASLNSCSPSGDSSASKTKPEASPAVSEVPLVSVGAPKDVEVATDYSKRGQWVRAAMLGANDGLVSTASLMMGVGAVKNDARAMLLSGLAGLVAGSCSMAIGEFVSVYSQLDVERSQIKRDIDLEASRRGPVEIVSSEGFKDGDDYEGLPSPFQAAWASAAAFTAGALVPLLSAAFIKAYWVRMGVAAATSTVALLAFGGVGASVGRSPVVPAMVRVLLGGWAAMITTYGILRLFSSLGVR